MKLGDLEFYLLTDGYFCLDGGAMFGVIPRPLWERKAPPDERNRIRLAMNSLLIRSAGKWILIETGAGDKWDAKQRDIFAFEGDLRLPEQLAQRGVRPERSEEHTSELQSLAYLVCRLLLEKKKITLGDLRLDRRVRPLRLRHFLATPLC